MSVGIVNENRIRKGAGGGSRSLWLDMLGAEVRYYDVGGIRTRCIEAGAGPVVVFLHGQGGHAEAFARNIVPLSERYRVLAIDYLGFGLTDPPAVAPERDDYVEHLVGFLDAAGADRAHLVGESLGGWIAMWTALLHPQRVDKLVSVCGARLALDEDEESRRHVEEGLANLRRLSAEFVESPSRDAVRRRMEWLFADPDKDLTDELVDLRWALYQLPKVADVLTAANGPRNDGARGGVAPLTADRLAELGQETLFLWTSHNPTTTAATARRAAAVVPHARFELMQDCGHWPQWEASDSFNAILRDFLSAARTGTGAETSR